MLDVISQKFSCVLLILTCGGYTITWFFMHYLHLVLLTMLKSYRTRIVSYNSHKVIRDILVTYGCILCVQCGLNFHFSEKEKTGMTLLQPEWELLLDVVFQWNQPLTYVVITLDPPIRKGQTFYPHIVLQVLFWFRHKSVYVTYVLGITLTKKLKDSWIIWLTSTQQYLEMVLCIMACID